MRATLGAASLLLNTLTLFAQTPASAPAAPAAAQPNPLGTMLMWALLMGGFFWFFVIMPQNKQRKQLQQMMDNLKVGDRVVVLGGLHGQIHQIKDDTVLLRIAENVRIEVAKAAINKVLTEADEKAA